MLKSPDEAQSFAVDSVKSADITLRDVWRRRLFSVCRMRVSLAKAHKIAASTREFMQRWGSPICNV
jgi:hypothetical protein